MAREIGSLNVRIGLDSSGFQNGISSLNREMKVVESQFKASTAALGEHGRGAIYVPGDGFYISTNDGYTYYAEY